MIEQMNNLTLAITTIGDLLLEGRITRKKDGKPIENVWLSIPEYQRPYNGLHAMPSSCLMISSRLEPTTRKFIG